MEKRFNMEQHEARLKAAEDAMADFDPKWPHGHQLADGRKAEIMWTGPDGCHAVRVTRSDGSWWCDRWAADGRSVMGGAGNNPYDLINAPAPKRGLWVTLVEGPDGIWTSTYGDKAVALAAQYGPHCRCIALVEVKEGRFDE